VFLGHEEKPCTHQRAALRIERGFVPVHLDGYDTTWRMNPGDEPIVTIEWVVCRDCGKMWSVEPGDFDLGDGFVVVPRDG
jgi:hypothetical protein